MAVEIQQQGGAFTGLGSGVESGPQRVKRFRRVGFRCEQRTTTRKKRLAPPLDNTIQSHQIGVDVGRQDMRVRGIEPDRPRTDKRLHQPGSGGQSLQDAGQQPIFAARPFQKRATKIRPGRAGRRQGHALSRGA